MPTFSLLIFSSFASFIMHGTDGAFSRLVQTSRYQPYYISCNNTESASQSPTDLNTVVPIPTQTMFPASPGSDYFTPTILNYSPSITKGQSLENEDDMDIGNRISSLSTSLGTGTVWMPHRLALPSRLNSIYNTLTQEDQDKIIDVEQGLHFYLFTRENPVVSQEIKIHQKSTVEGSHFVASRPTKLILHGFTDVDAPGEWVNQIKIAYLNSFDFNIIVADYSSFSVNQLLRTTLPIFSSKRLAEMVVFLETDAGASRDSFHIIARSWASHIAGMAGRLLGGTIGRITALEPADKISINGAPEYKLEKEDALFVDVVHINGKRFFFHSGQFGLTAPSGHVDIYPNFAEKGLGCPGESLSIRRYNFRFCQLGRGVRYFTNSIKYPTAYPMCACRSFELYTAGRCSCSQFGSMEFMGENISKETRGVFQLAPTPQQNPIFANYRYYSPIFA